MDFMFDELFRPDYTMPERVSAEDAKAILADFAGMFDENDTPDGFFDKMKQIASAHGYAADTKAYKADPSAFKGAVGDGFPWSSASRSQAARTRPISRP